MSRRLHQSFPKSQQQKQTNDEEGQRRIFVATQKASPAPTTHQKENTKVTHGC
jgi:hypothetical protein